MYGQQPNKIKPPQAPKPDDDREINIDEWDDIVADRYKVPRSLMKAVRGQESGGNVNAVSPTGVRGRYQVTQSTAKQYGLDRNDPWQQSVAAARYLRDLYDQTDGADDDEKWLGSVAKYYGGGNAVKDGVVSGRSVDGLSNPAEHVRRVAERWGQIRKSETTGAMAAPASRVSPFDETEDQAKARRAGMTPAQRKEDRRQTIGAMQNELVESSRIMQQPAPPSGKATAGVFGQSRKGQAELRKAFKVDPSTGIQVFEDAGINRVNQRAALTPGIERRRDEIARRKAAYDQLTPREQLLQRIGQPLSSEAYNRANKDKIADLRRRAFNGDKTAQAELSQIEANQQDWEPVFRPDTPIAQHLSRPVNQAIGLAGTTIRGVGSSIPEYSPLSGVLKATTGRNARELAQSVTEPLGRGLTQAAGMVAPENPHDQSFIADVERGAGSLPAFIAAGALGGPAGVATVGSAMARGSVEQDLEQYEATRRQQGLPPIPQWRKEAALTVGSLAGALEAAGMKFDKFGGRRALIKWALEIPEEAAQESISKLIENLNAIYVGGYDPNRPVFQDVAKEGAIGGLLGAGFKGAELPSVLGERNAAIREAQAVQAERAPMPGIAPSVPAGTQTQVTRITPEAARAANQPVAPSVTPDIANAPTEPLTEPIATNQIPSEAIPAPSQPNAPLFPAAQQAEQDISQLQGFDKLAALEARRRGTAKTTPEQALNKEFERLNALAESPDEADRNDAVEGYNKLLARIRGSQQYAAEVRGGVAETPYRNARQVIEQRLQGLAKPTPKKAATPAVASQSAQLPDLLTQAEGFKQDAVAAEQAGNFEAAAIAYQSARDILRTANTRHGKTMAAPDLAALRQDINLQHGAFQNAQKQARDLQRQANKPTAGLPQPRRQAAQQPPPLMQSGAIVNPEGGIPAQAPKMTFTEELQRGIDQSDAARARRKPQKRLLSRIAELGGIDKRYAGELRDVKDARRIGVIRDRAQMSPDILARQLQSEGYDVDPDDLNTLWEAARRDISDERGFRPADSAALDRRLAEEEAAYYEKVQENERANTGRSGFSVPLGESAEQQASRPQSQQLRQDTGELDQAEDEDMAALRRAQERSERENPREYGERTRPGEPAGISFSDYSVLQSRNAKAEQALYDSAPGSPRFKAAEAAIRRDAQQVGIAPRHVDAMVAYALNYHSEKAFWAERGLDLDNLTSEQIDDVTQEFTERERRADEQIAQIKESAPSEADFIESQMRAVDELANTVADDPDMMAMLDAAVSGGKREVEDFVYAAGEAYGFDADAAREFVAARKRQQEPDTGQAAQVASQSRSERSTPSSSATPRQLTADERRLIQTRPVEVFDRDFDDYTRKVESLYAQAVRGEVAIDPKRLYDPAKWVGLTPEQIEEKRKAGEGAGLLAKIHGERAKRVEDGRLPARESLEQIEKYKGYSDEQLKALGKQEREGRKTRLETLENAVRVTLEKNPRGAKPEWMAEVRALDERLKGLKSVDKRPSERASRFIAEAENIASGIEGIKQKTRNYYQYSSQVDALNQLGLDPDKFIDNPAYRKLWADPDTGANRLTNTAAFGLLDIGVEPELIASAIRSGDISILPSIEQAKGIAEKKSAKPAPTGRVIQHSQFGEVRESADQSGVAKGKLRVVDSEGAEHVIQNPRTSGNRSAAFAKSEKAESAQEKSEPLPPDAYAEARKRPDGKYQLFYRGTRNEVFPSELFNSASEARQHLKVQRAKRDIARSSSEPKSTKPAESPAKPAEGKPSTSLDDDALRRRFGEIAEAIPRGSRLQQIAMGETLKGRLSFDKESKQWRLGPLSGRKLQDLIRAEKIAKTPEEKYLDFQKDIDRFLSGYPGRPLGKGLQEKLNDLKSLSDRVKRAEQLFKDTQKNSPSTDVDALLAAGTITPEQAAKMRRKPKISERREAPGFYSAAERFIEAKVPNKASGRQVLAMLTNPQSGVKQAELDWLGLPEWLRDKQSVTKQEVLDFVRANDVQIEEVVKGDEGSTKYGQYTLPGAKGGSYRELLLTLPNKQPSYFDKLRALGEKYNIQEPNQLKLEQVATPEEIKDLDATDFEPSERGYKSSHFDEPNILAHIRFNERTDADGKRVLHVEEIQSDWHQEGRKKGYATSYAVRQVTDDQGRIAYEVYNVTDGRSAGSPMAYEDQAQKQARKFTEESRSGDVPDAPFKKTWHELAFKRALRWAAENGYDRMTWTTGEQQAERFDLSKQVDSININRPKDGSFQISAEKDGRTVLPLRDVKDEAELESLIGKDLTQKALEIEPGDERDFSGIDLKVGGEGMKGFYDSILPAFANKYAKKWGAKVGTAKIETGEESRTRPTNYSIQPYGEDHIGNPTFSLFNNETGERVQRNFLSEEEAASYRDYLDRRHGALVDKVDGTTVHSLDITPAMRESVMAGQPKFRREAPGAMPERYTGRQLFENARVQFRPARNRPATLVANDWGGAMMNRLLSEKYGESTTDANFTIAADDMQELRDYLAETKDSGIYDEAQTANMDALLGQIDAAIKDAKANNQDVAFVTRKAGEPISQTKIKVRHETAHVSQSRVTPDMFALTERDWLGKQPEAAAVRAELERRGYPPETHAHESAVFVASGDFDAFGMNLDQATKFLSNYFKAVIQKHGRRALDRFGAIDPRLQPTLERARNEKTEAGQAANERRSVSYSPGTRRTGTAGTESGRSGAGVLAGRREGAAGVPRISERKEGFSFGRLENEPEGQIAAAGLGALQNLAGKIKKTKTPDAVPADYDVWDFYDQVMKQIMPGKDKQGNTKPPKTKINNEQADAIANGLLEMVEAADKQDFVGIFNAREKVRQALLPAAKRDVKWYDRMQSRLSNLNYKGTYERIAGADGKAVSELFRQAQVDMANGEASRTEAIKNLRKELRPYIKQFQLAGKPGLARWIENHINAVTDPDQSFKGLAGFLKGFQFYTKLAYNPRSAMVNLFQPMQTLWPHLSTREWLTIQKRATSRKEWQRIGEIAARESGGSIEGLARPDAPASAWRQSLKTGFFGYASEYNRVVGHLAGEMMADRQGITGKEKERMAADWAKKVEFDNSQWDIPPLFSSPVAGVVGQFKPFMVKNLERLYADWKSSPYAHQKGKDYKFINPSGNLARRSKMITGQLVLGGVKSAVPGIKFIGGVLILGGLAKAFGKFMDDDDAEKMAEAVYFGLPGLVEQDLSGSVTVFDEPFGKTAEEKMVNFFGGPTLSLAAKAWNTYGEVADAKDTDKSTAAEKRNRALLSLGKSISPYVKTGQAIAAAAKGETPKMWMGKDVPMTKAEAIGYGLMGTPLRQSKYYAHEDAPDWQKEIMPDRFTQSASTKTEFLNKFGQMAEQEIKRKPGEPDAVYQKRVERISGWMNTYGEKLVNHPMYNLLTAEQKQKAIENLRARVGKQMNLVRPNERTLEPQEVIKAVRKAATRKPRRGSEQLWEPEN